MARTDVETLVLSMQADVRGMQKALDKATRDADKAADKIENRFDKMQGGIDRSFSNIGNGLKTALAGVAVGAIAKDLVSLADTYTDVRNALKLYTDVLGDTDKAQQRVVATAIDTQQSFEAIGKLVSVTARIAGEIGESSENVFLFTEAVGKGAAIVNTGAAATSSALFQLGQALGSPRVQMGEFNSIIEGTPRLAKAFAEGVIGAGASVSQLKARITDMTGEGVSGAQLFQGLLSQIPQLRKEFAAADVTVASAFTNLQTRITAYVGEANEASGATRALIPLINFLAESVDDFANVAVVALVAIAGALTGLGTGATLAAIGNAARAIIGTKVAMELARAAAIQHAAANGTLTLSQLSIINATRSATAATALMTAASTAGAYALGVLRVALAAVGGPLGLIGAAVALLAFEMSKSNVELEAKARLAKEFEPIAERLKKATNELATAEGEHADAMQRSREEALKAAVAKLALARANAVAARAAIQAARDTTPTQGPVGEPGARGAAAGSAVGRSLVADAVLRRRTAELAAAEEEVKKIESIILEASQARVDSPAVAVPTGNGGGTGASAAQAAADAVAEQTKRIEDALDDAAQAAQDAETALSDAFDQAQQLRDELRDDALSFLDKLPDSTRAAYRELAALRALISAGIFVELGAENDAAKAQVQILRDIAYAAGDTTEALAELQRVSDLTPEQAKKAADDIRRAAKEGRAAQDEEVGRIFRVGEMAEDVKSAMAEAMRSGQWGDVFEQRVADALDRAASRGLDKAVDILFDTFGAIFREMGKSSGGSHEGSHSGGGGFWASLVTNVVKGFFGGGRATGGPISANRMYMTGERGPELIVPKSPGYVIPNNMLSALQAPARAANLTHRTDVNVKYTIDLAGANGDATIRDIARREAKRGAAEALRIAHKQSPSRSVQFQKLGT